MTQREYKDQRYILDQFHLDFEPHSRIPDVIVAILTPKDPAPGLVLEYRANIIYKAEWDLVSEPKAMSINDTIHYEVHQVLKIKTEPIQRCFGEVIGNYHEGERFFGHRYPVPFPFNPELIRCHFEIEAERKIANGDLELFENNLP